VSKQVIKALKELTESGVLSKEKAEEIRRYYKQGPNKSGQRLIIVFGVLGAILVGMGIILIIAHNWDDLSKSLKTFFAFLPLGIGQLICLFVIWKKRDSIAWREGTAAFLYFTVGASISLISQIYNIPGDLSSFMLTWMLLCLPLVYLMKSSITAMLVIIGITYFACETSYWSGPNKSSYEYWLVLIALLPQYYYLHKKKAKSNFLILLNWLIPLSIVICLGTLADKSEELMFIAYFGLFGQLYIIGGVSAYKDQPIRNNSFVILGSLGSIVLLLMLSFDWFWVDLQKETLNVLSAQEFYISIFVVLSAAAVLLFRIKKQGIISTQLMDYVFAIFPIIFIIGMHDVWTPTILINLLTLAVGLMTIKKGADRDHLGILNYGLLIITALVICRFFDTQISFVIRGLLFVGVGAGFFAANYMLIKKRKAHAN